MSDSQTIRISIEQTGSQVETVRSSIEQVSLTQVAHSQTSQFPLQVEETSRGSIQPGKPMSEFEVESPIFTNRSLDFNFRLPSLAVPEIPAPRIQMPKISLPRFNFKKPEFMKRDNFLYDFSILSTSLLSTSLHFAQPQTSLYSYNNSEDSKANSFAL